MFSGLLSYKTFLEGLAVVAVLCATAFAIHKFLNYEQQIGYDRRVAEDIAQAARDEKAARVKEAEDAKQKELAENERTLQGQRIDALASALSISTGQLRNVSGNFVRDLSNATTETARKTAIAFSDVFGDCSERYSALAKAADGHVADVRLFKESP